MPVKLSPARFAGRVSSNLAVLVDVTPKAPPPLESTRAGAYDLTSERWLYRLSYDDNGSKTPASLVKLMTALLLLERKGPSGEDVLASETATLTTAHITAAGGSLLGLANTDTATWDQWLYMLLVASDNAVGEMIADLIGDEIDAGGRTTFIALMNTRAAALGMTEATFDSPAGFPSELDRMSPNDIVKLTKALLALDSGAHRTYLSQSFYTFTLTAGPSSPSLGPYINPVDMMTEVPGGGFGSSTGIKDYGTVLAKGGFHTGPTPDTYNVMQLWQAPNGSEIIIVSLHATRDGNRYLDQRAMMYELPDDFTYLQAAAGTDADFASVTLLAGFDGSIVDESSVGRTLTARGDAVVNTTNPIVGTGDLALDGTGDLVDTPDTADMDFGAGDGTVECFIRGTGAEPGAVCAFVAKWNTTGNQRQWALQYDPATNKLVFFTSTTGADFPEASLDLDSLPADASVFFNGAKRHLLGRKLGSATDVFVNGQKGNLTGTAATLFANTALTTIGARYAGAAVELPFAGNIDEVRVTPGVDRTGGADKVQVSGRKFPRS